MNRITLLSAAILACFICQAKPTTPRTATQRAVQEAETSGPLSESVWGICAVTMRGDTLAWLNAQRRMVPASNMKLITTGAALLTFGGGYTFKTTFATDGEVADSVLNGNLYIIGGGDPMIGNLFSYLPRRETTFSKWHKILKDKGIKQINGDIIGDGSYFSGERRHTDWSTEDLRTRDGVVPSGLTWRGRMQDTIPDGPYPAALHFLEWMEGSSEIEVSGTAREGHADSLEVLGSLPSVPLRSIVRTANCQSDNFIAETLIKALGKRLNGNDGYTQSVSALHRALSPVGMMGPSGGMSFADGSGLSRKNYVSPSFMVRYLKAMAGSKVYKDFLASLPKAGEKGTTLERRLPGADAALKDRIRMKSGSMNGVRCFSGYILSADGNPSRTIVFSLFSNNAVGSNAQVYPVLDGIIRTLAQENR